MKINNKEITNVDIALYALYLLGGTIKKIQTEEIALKCFKIMPSRFSWIVHIEYPDMEPTRKALFEARSSKNDELVIGRHGKTKENQISDGWIFTPRGIDWIEKNKPQIELLIGQNKKRTNRTQIDKQISELKNSIAFRKFLRDKNCNNVLPYEFTNFLNASLDTPTSILSDRIDKIRAIAATAKEQRINDFISMAKRHFSNLLKIKSE